LRGYNIGGWMNMENFLTGYPGTESRQRRVLHRVLGPELYEAFFDQFMTVFFDDAEASWSWACTQRASPSRSRYKLFD
jgi:endoglucanase